MFWGIGRKPEYPERPTHTPGENANFTQKGYMHCIYIKNIVQRNNDLTYQVRMSSFLRAQWIYTVHLIFNISNLTLSVSATKACLFLFPSIFMMTFFQFPSLWCRNVKHFLFKLRHGFPQCNICFFRNSQSCSVYNC